MVKEIMQKSQSSISLVSCSVYRCFKIIMFACNQGNLQPLFPVYGLTQ